MSELIETDEPRRGDLAKLQGIWRTVSVEVDGDPVAAWLFQDARLVIAGDHFALRNPFPDADQRTEGNLRLDAAKVPKELNLTLDAGQTIEEIYEFDGKTLKVCFPTRDGKRPPEFKTTQQSGLSLVVYERESP